MKRISRRKLAALALGATLAILGWSDPFLARKSAPPRAQNIRQQDDRYHEVVKVVDGDTIDVRVGDATERVRMLGIDTPETVDPRRTVQCFGREASDKTRSLLAGAKVRLESDPTQADRDRYGRLLRYVSAEEGTDINLQLISKGFAHEYTFSVPYERQARYRAAEQEARTAARGLWAPGVCDRK